MTFGIFLAPFHRVGENPTLALTRDMELIEWLDYLGYDEVWIGEHHSAGWELIASPEVFIAAAAERTRQIKLGSGVTSLPYHHPLMVAERFVQLDHMTRGRAMLGCGPGALVSDAYMMGIEPVMQRPRMDEALDAIMLLLKCEEPVTLKTDWFELREARLHLAPYTEPHLEIAVASVMTPAGVIAAGRHGLGVLSIGAGLPGGPDALAGQWKIAEETAAKHGKKMDRKKWRLVVNVHVADDDDEALRHVNKAERHETVTYFEETLGRPPGSPAPRESTPMPCLPAVMTPAGVIVLATAIGKCGSVYGARCSRASRRSNQSVFMVTGSSQRRSAMITPRASSMRCRCVTGSMPSM